MLGSLLTRDNSMEAGTLVTVAFLSSAKGAEVFRGFGHNVGVELEDYSGRRAYPKVRTHKCEYY